MINVNKFFIFIKRFIFSALLIYSFDMLGVSLNMSIPINFFTILLVCFFDFSALFCLILFSFFY